MRPHPPALRLSELYLLSTRPSGLGASINAARAAGQAGSSGYGRDGEQPRPVRVVMVSSREGYLLGLEAGERDLVLELVDDAVAVKVVGDDLPIGTIEVVVDVEIATIVEVDAVEVQVVAVQVVVVIHAD